MVAELSLQNEPEMTRSNTSVLLQNVCDLLELFELKRWFLEERKSKEDYKTIKLFLMI